MSWLDPEFDSVISFYCERQQHFAELADQLGVPTLGPEVRNELAALVGTENVPLLETIARIGCYGDTVEMERARKALAKEMKKHGHFPKRGKRTAPGLMEMVEDLTPVLLYFGVPPSLSESSPLVTALRYIGEGMGVPGDPRKELRKLERLDAKISKLQMEAIREAVRNGLNNLKI